MSGSITRDRTDYPWSPHSSPKCAHEDFLGSSRTGASPPNSYLQGQSLLGRLALRARVEVHFCPPSPEQVLRCSRKTVILSWARPWVL